MRWIILLLSFIFIQGMDAQVPSTPEEIEKQYNKNINKSRIDGVYIPKDVEEAITEIINLSPAESLVKFAAAEEKFVVKRLHFGLGKWIATKWNFEEGSRYSHYLKKQGVSDPDDMIHITLTALHRHLNHTPLKLEVDIQKIKEKRLQEHQKRLENRKVVSTSTSKIDTAKIK